MSGKTVFVNNLKFSAGEDDLREFFSQVGKVVSVSIFMSGERSKGCALVEFETEEECQRAFSLKDKDLLGRPVNVCEDRPIEERRKPRRYEGTRRESRDVREVKITGYPSDTNWREIKDFVEEVYQKPDYAKCFYPRSDDHYAIVRFDDESLLPGAVKAINGKELKGQTLTAIENVYKY